MYLVQVLEAVGDLCWCRLSLKSLPTRESMNDNYLPRL